MLERIDADRSSFKTIDFNPGLNIVLAERVAASERDDRRSRNGAGKTSLINIIHFMLGGDPDGALKSEELAEWNFELQMNLAGSSVNCARSVATKRKITLTGNDPDITQILDEHGQAKNSDWIKLLGSKWFQLPSSRQRTGAASFRSLISYFARRGDSGGFLEPTKFFRAQRRAVEEVNLAYLFGLDSELVRRLHVTKSKQDKIGKAKGAIANLEKQLSGQKVTDLEAALQAALGAESLAFESLRTEVDNYRVLPAFRELEQELADVILRSRHLSDEDVIDQELINAHEQALSDEVWPEAVKLEDLYDETNVIFPDLVKKRYEDAHEFHEALVRNRREYLASELVAAQARIEGRSSDRSQLDARRSSIVRELASGGAADELLRLRSELSEREKRVAELRTRLEEVTKVERHYEELGAEIDEAGRAVRADWRDRASVVQNASRGFSAISQRLYEEPGQLVISGTEDGVSFTPRIPGDRSSGIKNMQIFCFDMTLATICSNRDFGPGFIAHDSQLFEPVDGRQFAKALRIGAEIVNEIGWQIPCHS